jgi:DNA/RNA-binding domain of Phe-tRNA-synthetase-like protein
MALFQYDPAIFETFPNLVAGVVIARNIENTPNEAFALQYETEQKAIATILADRAPADIPQFVAWRGAFRKFGVDPTQYRSACEALFRRLTKKGDIPHINTLVDIGNLISIRHLIPVAAIDIADIHGGLTVQFSDGTETFTILDGEEKTEHPDIGEVIFSDDDKRVFARRWCWRQSNASAARERTTDALIVMEAHHDTALNDMPIALAELTNLLTQYTRANCQTSILDRNTMGLG